MATEYDDIDDLSEEELENLTDRGDNVEDDEEDEDGEQESVEEEDGESEEGEEDGESDPEGDDEVEEEEDEDPEEEEETQHIKIPKWRLDQEREKNKALKEREKWLEEQLTKLINANQGTKKEVEKEAAEEVFSFDDAEEAYIAAIVEGDAVEAKRIRKQIDIEKTKLIKKEIEAENNESIRKIQLQKEEETFQTAIKNFESKYSFFDPNKKAYNEDAVDTVNTLMTGFIAKGLSKVEALEKAVQKVVPMFHKEPEKTGKEVDTKKRLVDQRKKNVQTMKKTPPKLSGRKSYSEVPDVDLDNMDEKEFAKLSKDKKTMAKLRGDLL